jgi:HEAT repeat protein
MKTTVLLFLPWLAVAAETPAIERLFDAKLNPTQRAGACFELRGQSDTATIAAMTRAIEVTDLTACAAENLRVAGAIDALEQGLANRAPEVRAAAARVLGSFEKPELLASLNQAAQDQNALVATNALAALSQYQDPAVVPYLSILAAKGGMIGDMALERLRHLDGAAALAIARQLLASPQVPDQLYAMQVIGSAGDRSDLPSLRKIAGGPHETLSQNNRGFGFMPPINLARAAQSAIASIEARP